MLSHQPLDQFQVVAPLGGCGQQLRFEQPIEADQGRVARQFVLDQRRSLGGALVLQHQREQRVQQVEGRVLRFVIAQLADSVSQVPELAVRIGKAIGGQRQKHRVLRLDPLPRVDRRRPVALLQREVPQDQVGPRAAAMHREGTLEFAPRHRQVRSKQRRLREFAVILRNLLEIRLLREDFHPLHRGYRFRPVLLRLVDRYQVR